MQFLAESQAREEKKKFKKSKKERKLKSRKKASIVEELEAMVSRIDMHACFYVSLLLLTLSSFYSKA